MRLRLVALPACACLSSATKVSLDIRSLSNWGEQGGLLSTSEIDTLMRAVSAADVRSVLEVGHYYGLSTCAIVRALQERGGDWKFTTVDAHVPDSWVGRPAPISAFEANRIVHFDDPRLTAVFGMSQEITAIDADFVFYDGDHGEEQLRFTRVVIASPSIRRFLFDDRDFNWPVICCEELRAAGWIDKSPELIRQGGDKAHAGTQTLGWFERE